MFEEYADRIRRIETSQKTTCSHCQHLNIDTASEYEWPCPLLRDWICETHCCEIQMESGASTRAAVASQIGWPSNPTEMLNVCGICPNAEKKLAAG